jgi:hypothetical protein
MNDEQKPILVADHEPGIPRLGKLRLEQTADHLAPTEHPAARVHR